MKNIDMKILFFTMLTSMVSLQPVKAQIVSDTIILDSIEIAIKTPEKKVEIERILSNVIWSQIDFTKLENTSEKFLVFVMFGIRTNSEGRIDGFYTRRRLPSTFVEILKPGADLDNAMKSLEYLFKGNENKILLFPTVIRRLSSASSDNSYWDNVSYLIDIWPQIPADNKLPLVFLKTYYAPFSNHKN